MAASLSKSLTVRDYYKSPQLSQAEAARQAGTSEQLVGFADIVRKYAPELVSAIQTGGSLRQAYEIAKKRKEAAQEEHEALTKLRTRSPDYAEKVDLGVWSLQEALAAETAVERAYRDGCTGALVK